MRLKFNLVCSLLGLSLLVGVARAGQESSPAQVKGGVLTNTAGMTLYTFDKDPPGKSACNDKCAVTWPPLMAKTGDSATGDYTIISRDDGSKQWAYKGKPLYLFSKDQKPGDTSGEGVGNVWHTAKP
jgi:predicted lipoprotein with Yx(FWY)xxD motif